MFRKKRLNGPLRTKVGRSLTELPDHISPKMRFSFEIFGDDAVVSHQGKCLNHNLSGVTRISKRFDISVHSGRENKLSQAVSVCPDRLSFINASVFEHQPCFSAVFHNTDAITAFIVCMRFSASWNTMLASLSNTSSVTSMPSGSPYFSATVFPMPVFIS